MTDESALYRQIHPTFIQNGQASSMAFRPLDKAVDQLSVYDGDLIGAEQAWKHYTQTQKLKSAGSMSIIVAECQQISLPVLPAPEDFEEQVHIDFAGLGKGERIAKSKVLAAHANNRGWAYKAEI